jgi:hypothetical protein
MVQMAAESGPEGPIAIAIALRAGMSPEEVVLFAEQAREMLRREGLPD